MKAFVQAAEVNVNFAASSDCVITNLVFRLDSYNDDFRSMSLRKGVVEQAEDDLLRPQLLKFKYGSARQLVVNPHFYVFPFQLEVQHVQQWLQNVFLELVSVEVHLEGVLGNTI
jgi:hypothetical protein